MFLKKWSVIFRHTSTVSVALYTQRLCCKIIKSISQADKSLRKRLKNNYPKITVRTKKGKKNMDKKDIEENSQLKSGNSKFFVINMKKLLSKITLRKIRYPRCKQANNILSDFSNSEAFSAKLPPTHESCNLNLLDKDLQCSSATALHFQERGEKGDVATLK